MRSLTVPNANIALAEVLQQITQYISAPEGNSDWSTTDSRNGPVIKSNTPFTTAYLFSQQRVSFDPERDSNPFFSLLESFWMLAGRNDVAFPSYYAANIANYSDDGVTLNGAYGYRWRQTFGEDQIGLIIQELVDNPLSRRCVLQMWNAMPHKIDIAGLIVMKPSELSSQTKDKCCNMSVVFQARKAFRPHEDTTKTYLDITVFNLSNDIVYGAYGANSVHFSVLQELVANCSELEIGTYYQVSNNFHLYTEFPIVKKLLVAAKSGAYTGYTEQDLYWKDDLSWVDSTTLFVERSQSGEPIPVLYSAITEDIRELFGNWDARSPEERKGMSTDEFCRRTFVSDYKGLPNYLQLALTMIVAYEHHKSRDYDAALAECQKIAIHEDWHRACVHWLQRRQQNFINKGNANEQ